MSGQPVPWTPERDAHALRRDVAAATGRLLMLDYDGTLAPFRVERDQAGPWEGVRGRLVRLMNAPANRVVIISGRAVRDLLPLVGLDPAPEIHGSHGFERRTPDGMARVRPLGDAVRRGFDMARREVASLNLEDRLEPKPAGLAFHWRGEDPAAVERLRRLVFDGWGDVARGHELDLLEFDGGLELRARGVDKGTVVGELLEEVGEGVLSAYLGDDRTDEDAFGALGGRGLGVLVRDEPRATRAARWLQPPGDLLAFLDAWAEGCERPR
jgi:trehalose 6-phosphate phosphatase